MFYITFLHFCYLRTLHALTLVCSKSSRILQSHHELISRKLVSFQAILNLDCFVHAILNHLSRMLQYFSIHISLYLSNDVKISDEEMKSQTEIFLWHLSSGLIQTRLLQNTVLQYFQKFNQLPYFLSDI